MTAGVPVDAVARFEGELRRFVTRRVPGPDGDDVLQDALLRIHLRVGALRSTDRLAPWVYRVARSAIIDHHRRSRPGEPLGDDDDIELPEEPRSEIRATLAACVAPFLEGLPPEQAEALRLTDLGGLTQVAAAERLGVRLATMKARVQRGRRRMRDAFEACCELEQDGRGIVIEATPRGCGCA